MKQYGSDPATNAYLMTANDSGSVATTRAVYVGGGGDVTVDLLDSGANITFKSVPTGSILPIRIKRLYVTGTTANNILGLY